MYSGNTLITSSADSEISLRLLYTIVTFPDGFSILILPFSFLYSNHKVKQLDPSVFNPEIDVFIILNIFILSVSRRK